MAKQSLIPRWLIILVGVLLAGWMCYSFLPFYLADKEMKQFCTGLATGLSMADVQTKSAEQGYTVSPLVEGRAVLEDPRSYGRRSCTLRFGPQGLVSVE